MSETIRRRSLPDSLRWLADKLDSGTLTDAERAGVGLTLHMLADDLNPPDPQETGPGPDGDPDSMCGEPHRFEHHGVARCSRGHGHVGVHAGHADDGTACQWPGDGPE